MYTDTHCHLYLDAFQADLDAVLERAWSAGVGRIMIPGIDLETSRQAIELSERDPRLYAAVGVHPNHCAGWTAASLSALRGLAAHPKVRAIGEIGLDYYWEETPHAWQAEVLRAQLALAEELSLPVVIHNRESFYDLWPILETWQQQLSQVGSALAETPGVLHSFEGEIAQAQSAVERHFLLGISGPVTFKNARARQDMVAAMPVDALLIETDAPYLTPDPFRGRRNEPAHVVRITDKIAELQQQQPERVANITARNASRLFRWENTD
jgi:TatD DNase family protein